MILNRCYGVIIKKKNIERCLLLWFLHIFVMKFLASSIEIIFYHKNSCC